MTLGGHSPCDLDCQVFQCIKEKGDKRKGMVFRDVVQLARTPALGAGGRRFESSHPDQ